MKLHLKGFLLTQLHQLGGMRDTRLLALTMQTYALTGQFARNSLRIALDELSSAGLVHRQAPELVSEQGQEVLSFHYQLSAFGRQRMHDTGLIAASSLIEQDN